MIREFVRHRRMVPLAALLSVAALAGCDPRQAVEPETVEPTAAPAIAGRVLDARTGAPVAGARVEARGLGNGVTDREGMYRIGTPEALTGLASTMVHAEADGFAPALREVSLAGGFPQTPALVLTPLAPGVRIGPEGGEFRLPNGAVVLVPAGALASETEVRVTLLGSTIPGPEQDGERVSPTQSFHVSTGGARLSKPLQVRLPLGRPVPHGTRMHLWAFQIATGKWDSAGSVEVERDGLSAPVPVYADMTIAGYPNDIVTHQLTQALTIEKDGYEKVAQCLEGPAVLTIPEGEYDTELELSVPPQIAEVEAHLRGLWGFPRVYPSLEIEVQSGASVDLFVRAVWERDKRTGVAWRVNSPEDRYGYAHSHLLFSGWEVAYRECDFQGTITASRTRPSLPPGGRP